MACLADLDSPEPRGGGGAAAPSCVPASRAAITLYSQRVYTGRFLGREVIIKERAPKKYRHPTLDAKLTHQRLAHEVRCMVHCRREGLLVPSLLFVDPVRHQIFMERVPGQTVRELLFSTREDDPVRQQVCAAMGEAVARLHDAGIVHGDLTTSNMIVRAGDQRLVLIDFGLSYLKGSAEDKAVDLYVLERAFLSTHPNSQPLIDAFMAAYSAKARCFSGVGQKLAQVRARGRKRLAFG